RPLADIGGKALWTKELDLWLHEGVIDFAVHSLKDVETFRPDWLTIAAILPREDVRDCLVGAESIAALPHGARLGTSAPRRAAQALNLRPDLKIVPFRGNVATRLGKLAAGEAEATLLAMAGLNRLDQATVGTPLEPDAWLPAPGQGAIAIECRRNDAATRAILSPIDHEESRIAVLAERALLAALGGNCHSAIAPRWRGSNRRQGQLCPAGPWPDCRAGGGSPVTGAQGDRHPFCRSRTLSMKPPIVILRPEPGANVSLQGAMALGLDAWCFPMFITLPRAWEAPSADTFDALLLGSANALRYGGAELAGYGDKPAYCVGETTARGAAARGIKIADTGSGGLQDMLNRMAGGRLRLLRLAGEERVTLTPPPGITIEERVVYASMPVPMPVELARLLSTAALPRIIVLLHSGAAARHLIEECR
ncbi:hypothetical protein E4T56_gene13637, partial [Termitomyces sp. T112]